MTVIMLCPLIFPWIYYTRYTHKYLFFLRFNIHCLNECYTPMICNMITVNHQLSMAWLVFTWPMCFQEWTFDVSNIKLSTWCLHHFKFAENPCKVSVILKQDESRSISHKHQAFVTSFTVRSSVVDHCPARAAPLGLIKHGKIDM